MSRNKSPAEKYQVSYQQARNYTVKYESLGVEALRDNLGIRKSEDQMSALEMNLIVLKTYY